MPDGRSAAAGLDLDRRRLGLDVGLELLLMLEAQLGDGLVALQQCLLQFLDPALGVGLQPVQSLPQFDRFLVNLHDPGGGEGVQVRAVVAIGALEAERRILAAAHDFHSD
jgi:hypothetical protein